MLLVFFLILDLDVYPPYLLYLSRNIQYLYMWVFHVFRWDPCAYLLTKGMG